MFEESAKLLVWLIPVVLLAVIILPQMVRILREYERGVIFRLGKLLGTKGPGVIFLIPIVDRMVRIDLRVVTIDVARQEVMTRDNVPMTVDAVVYFSRHRSSVCGRASGELPESDFAHFADNVA
jgi:regulator of protease activity HflC (stomatin/prohibitin superfamily)